jgi:hypothetical protein
MITITLKIQSNELGPVGCQSSAVETEPVTPQEKRLSQWLRQVFEVGSRRYIDVVGGGIGGSVGGKYTEADKEKLLTAVKQAMMKRRGEGN